uniref:Putative calmodulin n=1 Tax=Lutzomyia longipalpis TaxID=7200 RepID=A0A1B0CBX9_LUTLO
NFPPQIERQNRQQREFQYQSHISCIFSHPFLCTFLPPGNGLIDEAEFLQWIARIQAIKDESASSSSSTGSTQQLSEEDDITQDLIAAFRVFDRDGNGYITRDELQTAMDMIGENVTESQLTEMLALADLDKDGRINYEGNGLIDEAEFLQWIARIQAIKDESASSSSSTGSTQQLSEEDDITQDLIAAFRVFDRDGNGYITRDELQTAMDMIGENVTESQLTEMLALADLDKDGRINYEEFIRLLL